MVTPLVRLKSIKKRSKRFIRHQSDRRITVKVRSALKLDWTDGLSSSSVGCMQGLGAAARSSQQNSVAMPAACVLCLRRRLSRPPARSAFTPPPPAGELAPAQGY